MSRHQPLYKRPPGRRLAALSALLAALVAAAVAGGLPNLAHAATTTTPVWSANTGANSGYSPNLMADTSGVTVQPDTAVLDRPSATLYQRFDRDGIAGMTIGFTTDYSTSVADAAGDIFEIEYLWSGPSGAQTATAELRLRTLSSGIVWRTTITPDFNILHDNYQLAISDNRVYVLGVDSAEHLLIGTYNAADGSLVALLPLPANLQTQALYPYQGGVFVVDASGTSAAYIGPDGQIAHQYQPPASTKFWGPVAVNPDGTAYVLYGSPSYGIPEQLIALAPSQGVEWTKPLPDPLASAGTSTNDYRIAVTSDGGALVGANRAAWSDGTAPALTKFGADGTNTWTEHVPLANQLDTLVELHGTSNGQFITGIQHANACAGCFQIDFGLNDQSSGALTGTIAQLGDPSTSETFGYQASTPGQPNSLAAEGDRLYLTARHTDYANYDQRTIFGFAPGLVLGTTYPEDTVRATVTLQPAPSPSTSPSASAPPSVSPSASASASPSASASVTPPINCAKLEIFGLRGSRNDVNDKADSDGVLDAFAQKIKAKEPSADFQPVRYPAIPVGFGGISAYGTNYVSSMFAGVGALDRVIVPFLQKCTSSYVMVVGYSQGADAALTEIDSFFRLYPKLARRVLAVITYGDPEFNPRQPQIDDGDYNKRYHGIWGELPNSSLRVLFASAVPKTRSFCANGDPVCNYSIANLAACARRQTCTHLQYVERGWVTLGALWALKKWQSR